MRLSPGFGTVRLIDKARTNPYAVHPPTKDGKRPKAICYVPDRATGIAVLKLYHEGRYKPGPESILAAGSGDSCGNSSNGGFDSRSCGSSTGRIYSKSISSKGCSGGGINGSCSNSERFGASRESAPFHTFTSVYESFLEHKFGPHAAKELKKSTKNGYNSAWMKLEALYDLSLDEVNIDDLEEIVYDVADSGYSKTTVTRVVTLIHQLYQFALARGYCEKSRGLYVQMPSAKEEVHHQDFTDEELKKMWEAYRTSTDKFVKDTVRMILIMCYSGFRIREYETLDFLDGEVPHFRGGLKTDAGKNRVVPVHSRILPLVREISGIFLCGKKNGQFRRDMKKVLVEIGVDEEAVCHRKCYGEKPSEDVPDTKAETRYHTPHSTRHTFSRLCESYDVKEADRKRMMGHSLKGDVTNGVYGHRSLTELSSQIEKIEQAVMTV
ncbi:MAG: hypothetical protein IJ106_09925 [Parasporobacterium sp.]|nr:hypothetical protein [Parasporobacterium sp.]